MGSTQTALASVPPPSPAAATALTVVAKPGDSGTALAPGFRFHPTDEELISYYLKRKVYNKPFRFNAIAVVDIYRHEPWELSDKSKLKTRDQEWYFFSILDRKYGNGGRMNRATNTGYWKATGKDREIRHNGHLVGMKKTLVFHTGRAPGGTRTNWVMHEYRLVEGELERIEPVQGYVLCRVFHKNSIGPPNGHRYAPFVEAEWDDGSTVLVPGVDAGNDVVTAYAIVGNDVAIAENAVIRSDAVQRIGSEEETRYASEDGLRIGEFPRGSLNERTDYHLPLPLCKVERPDDCPPICVLNKEASLPILRYKRRRSSPNRRNVSDNSTGTIQDRCSSTTTTATTTTELEQSAATTTAVSALLEFSLMESIEPRENSKPRVPPPVFDTAKLDSVVPPGCMDLINELQNEIHKISVERETLKLEMMSAQAMINILQSRIDFLSQENKELKRSNNNRDA